MVMEGQVSVKDKKVSFEKTLRIQLWMGRVDEVVLWR